MPEWLSERTILLVGHVGASVLLFGPVTVAVSLFPRYALAGDRGICQLLHRISGGYGLLTLVVPLFGLILATRHDLLTQPWVVLSLLIFGAAFLMLLGLIVPRQEALLDGLDGDGPPPGRSDVAVLRMTGGLYSLSWFVVLVLMVAKPA
jgi:hypothetical protein